MPQAPKEYNQIQEMVLNCISKTPLDPFPVFFEVISADEMNAIASYGGFPTRYQHWRFGMEYERNKKMGKYSLQKLYEIVINNNPTYAYLIEGSDLATIKAVMAHVYAHSDFFKNNLLFKNTNRNMINKMGDNAAAISKIINLQGLEKVESFIDSCLMIEDLIDPNCLAAPKKNKESPLFYEEEPAIEIPRFKAKDYMQDFINPQEFLEAQKEKIEEEKLRNKEKLPEPERNIMKFLLENAPLESWEEQVLSIILEESYYFLPQKQTKIINEGWATYWHSKLMTNHLLKPEKILEPDELLTYSDMHSKIVQRHGNSINPYRLGLELFSYIEHCWDTGRHGKEYEECDDMQRKANWDTRECNGLEKILLIRKCYNDIMLIDEFFTPEFAEENNYYIYLNNSNWANVISSKDFEDIKEQLLNKLTNFGLPLMYIIDGNFKNKGELQIYHQWTGTQLRRDFAETTLKNIARIWKRPVNLETIDPSNDKNIRIITDGEKVRSESGTSKKFI